MRLNDRLIRKNCPACGDEITLETSALDKKITCPKCRQSVVIVSDDPPPAKPASKKSAPKRKRDTPEPQPSPEKAPASLEELRISIQRRNEGEETQTQAPVVYETASSDKRAVVYCICNGVLKRCTDGNACCVKPEFCVYVDEMGL